MTFSLDSADKSSEFLSERLRFHVVVVSAMAAAKGGLRKRARHPRSPHGQPQRPVVEARQPWAGTFARGELLLVVVVVAAGILLRLAWPSQMAVEHFDKGVYSSNLWFTQELGYKFHLRHLYAPPLLPALIEASLVIEQLFLRPGGEPSSFAVMAPSLLAGSATPALLWWVTRCWFGSTPAIATLVLASFNDFHALYSRTALTDVVLMFFLVLAVWFGERACTENRPKWVLAAGLGTALAWWTKYNGWLPLAILLSGLIVAFLFDPPNAS